MSAGDPGPDRDDRDVPEGGRDLEPVLRGLPGAEGGSRDLPLLGAGGARLQVDRRRVIKMMAAAAVAPALGGCEPSGEGDPGAASRAATPPTPSSNPLAAGTLWDPDLIAPTVPWEKTLTEDERATLAVLCDVIIPADDRSPSASSVGAHDFIDEYVSAPYEPMERDRVLVRGGLVWLDAEAARRFGGGARFRALDAARQHAICDDICSSDAAEPPFLQAARFFDKVRDLTATAFYTTPEGMDDIGYVGNVPLAGPWPAPPAEALRHLGLEGAI
ncbi:MAG TPA: gluconate 2-dehydrogenase subunit 3 family protein [Longimicrobiales bacterium]|nr:gluconate 2-dehydrogenase subunit 3 family protein [Longimicrobiales bacterium]